MRSSFFLSEKRCLAAVRITMQVFQDWLTTGWTAGKENIIRCEKGVPPSARLVGVQLIDLGMALPDVCLIFEDSSFSSIEIYADLQSGPSANIIPILEVIYSSKAK